MFLRDGDVKQRKTYNDGTISIPSPLPSPSSHKSKYGVRGVRKLPSGIYGAAMDMTVNLKMHIW